MSLVLTDFGSHADLVVACEPSIQMTAAESSEPSMFLQHT